MLDRKERVYFVEIWSACCADEAILLFTQCPTIDEICEGIKQELSGTYDDNHVQKFLDVVQALQTHPLHKTVQALDDNGVKIGCVTIGFKHLYKVGP